MDSPVVTLPARFGDERFRVIKHTWPWVDGVVVHMAVLMDVEGFKLSVPYASLVPVNQQRNQA